MNKKQEEIYNWLKEHKGYIKKGRNFLITFPYLTKYRIKDIEIALKSIREDFKGTYYNSKDSIPKSAKSVLNQVKPRKTVALDYRYEIEPKKSFKDTPWGKKIASFSIKPKNTLIIADTHFPFCKEGYLEHCLEMYKKYDCNRVIHIGDEVDLCGVSQWEKDPDGFSAGTEAYMAQQDMKKWYKAFPEVFVCIGNHTARPFRQARSNGIPKKFIKSYEEAWEAPEGWKWAESWEFDNVLYTHGTGFSGPNAAIRIATRHRQNTVIGHVHSEAGIQYSASKIDLVWGMQVGAALDDSSYAAYYAKDQLKKSIVGCGIVLEGKLPIYEPMKL